MDISLNFPGWDQDRRTNS